MKLIKKIDHFFFGLHEEDTAEYNELGKLWFYGPLTAIVLIAFFLKVVVG